MVVWLPEQFPLAAPIVYVEPTSEMMVKPGHPFVEPSGLVSSLYLDNWLFPGSSLRILAEVGIDRLMDTKIWSLLNSNLRWAYPYLHHGRTSQ